MSFVWGPAEVTIVFVLWLLAMLLIMDLWPQGKVKAGVFIASCLVMFVFLGTTLRF